jgi:hypothetical protein
MNHITNIKGKKMLQRMSDDADWLYAVYHRSVSANKPFIDYLIDYADI